MTDHDLTPHDPAELASAYLDGDAPAEARARVEASAELSALVQSFRGVREQLADVPPATDTVREAAFAAALAEFDKPAAPVVSLASRRRWPGAVMKVAAALALVGVVGVAVFGGDSDSDENSSSSEERMSDMAAADTTSKVENAGGGAPTSTIGSIDGGVEVAQVIESPEELKRLAPATTMAASDTTAAPGESENTQPGADPDDGTGSGDALPEGMPPTARPSIVCLTETQQFLADIYYQQQYAIAVIDTVTGVITAIADDCSVIASVGP
jgi:hypothetical protein